MIYAAPEAQTHLFFFPSSVILHHTALQHCTTLHYNITPHYTTTLQHTALQHRSTLHYNTAPHSTTILHHTAPPDQTKLKHNGTNATPPASEDGVFNCSEQLPLRVDSGDPSGMARSSTVHSQSELQETVENRFLLANGLVV